MEEQTLMAQKIAIIAAIAIKMASLRTTELLTIFKISVERR